jgi:chlorobactene glucosyltransferase
MLVLSFAWLFAVIVLISRAFRQRGLLRELVRPVEGYIPKQSVTIIVPARNEAGNIGRCLKSLIAQNYPRLYLRIAAIDDNSADSTPEIIEGFASSGVEFHDAPPLPAGWTGKCHACWTAAKTAADESEWLCFTDADIEASPELLPAAMSVAVSEGIDFLSLTPRQRMLSFSERLIMPCGLYLLGFSQNLSDVSSPSSKDVTATGQFILIRSTAYKAIGGHYAARGEICEDLALARLVKRHGYRTALLGGSALFSARMYTGWSNLWPGVTKNLMVMAGGPVRTVFAAFIALALAWAAPLLPILDALRLGQSPEAGVALAMAAPASAAAFGLHLAGARYFRIPLWYGLIFPLGYSVGAILALDSVRRSLTGKISWKGRTYE